MAKTFFTAGGWNNNDPITMFTRLIRRSIDPKDEFEYLDLTTPLGVAMLKAKDEARKREDEAAQEELVTLLKKLKDAKSRHVAAIRNARRIEKECKQQLAMIDRAFLYAERENDFRPLLHAIECYHTEAKVPDDWQPSAGSTDGGAFTSE